MLVNSPLYVQISCIRLSDKTSRRGAIRKPSSMFGAISDAGGRSQGHYVPREESRSRS
jgi:hypothetical protein